MLELLFLLLPVAAAYGWYMGRRSAQQSKQDDASRLSRDYVAGVNFLLSNQQDKAVDLFLDMLKEDTGTVEAHLTLGNLFRSRGEVDRAIRIHQSRGHTRYPSGCQSAVARRFSRAATGTHSDGGVRSFT